MPDSMTIVLDKSFLRGTQSDKIQNLCREHSVLMISTLFEELMLADKKDRTICFQKFPQTVNPVIPIENVGGLMRYEVEHRTSCQPVCDRRVFEQFQFHPKLSEGNFIFDAIQRKSIEERKKELKNKKIKDHKEASASVIGWFPELADYSPGQDERKIKELMKKVSEDDDLIRYRYNQIKPPEAPEGEILSRDWALFRRTQAHLLYALEYIRKYGPDSNVISGKLENEILDIDYCITGSLAGCLASKDKKIREIFRIMCPNGRLLPDQLSCDKDKKFKVM